MNICLLNDSFPPIIDGVANVVMNYASVMTNELNSNVVVGTPRYPDVNYDGYPYRVVVSTPRSLSRGIAPEILCL